MPDQTLDELLAPSPTGDEVSLDELLAPSVTKSAQGALNAIETSSSERGFFNKLGLSFSRGKEYADIDLLDFEAALGARNWEANSLMRKSLQEKMAADPVEASSWFSKALYDAAGIAGPMVEGMTQGAGVGAAAAGAAALGGQLGPQALLPEEALTVPGAFATGMAAGSMQYWYRQGVGNIYNTMRESGIDHDVASPMSIVAGIPYAAIERMQVNKVVPGLDKFMKRQFTGVIKKVSPSLVKRMGGVIAKYGKHVGINVVQEGAQKGIEIIADEMGKEVNDYLKGTDIPNRTAGQIADAVVDEMKATAAPIAVLMLPGAANSAVNSIFVEDAINKSEQDYLDQRQKESEKADVIETEQDVDKLIKEDIIQLPAYTESNIAERQALNLGLLPEYTESGFREEFEELSPAERQVKNILGTKGEEDEFTAGEIARVDKILDDIFKNKDVNVDTPGGKLMDAAVGKDDPVASLDIDVTKEKKYGSARRKFFALLNSRGITREQFSSARDINMKLSGQDAVSYDVLSGAIDILQHVEPEWTDQEKLDYIKAGVPPIVAQESDRADLHNEASVTEYERFRKNFTASGETAINKLYDKLGIDNKITPMLQSYRKIKDEIRGRSEVFGSDYFKGGLLKAYKDIVGNNKKKAMAFVNWLDGRESNISEYPRVRALAQLTRDMLDSIEGQARDANVSGKKITNKGVENIELGHIENYFPHGYDYDPSWNAKSTARFVNRVRESVKKANEKKGIELTDEQATIMARKVVARIKKLNSERAKGKASGYQFEREAEEGGWIGDPDDPSFKASEPLRALIRYIDGMSDVVAQHKAFGVDNANLEKELNKIGIKENDAYKFASEIVNNIIGNYQRDAAYLPTFTRTAKMFQAIKLQYAATGNIFQNLVTTAPLHSTLGLRRSATGFFKSAWDMIADRANSRDYAHTVGALAEQVSKDLTSYADNGIPTDNWMLNMVQKIGSKSAKAVMKVGMFKQSEFYNNVWAATWGKQIAKDALYIIKTKNPNSRLYKNAVKTFEYLGVSEEALEGYKITEDQNALGEMFDYVAWMTALRTQFRQTPMDLPQLPTTNSMAKLAFTFKGFAFNFGKFQKDMVWKPAWDFVKSGGKNGTIAPMATMLSTQFFAAEARNLFRYLLTGKEPPDLKDEKFQRILWDIFYSGGFGIAVDFIIDTSRSGNPFMFFGGPFVDDVADILGTPFKRAFQQESVGDGMDAFIKEFGKAVGKRVPFAQTIDHILGTNIHGGKK